MTRARARHWPHAATTAAGTGPATKAAMRTATTGPAASPATSPATQAATRAAKKRATRAAAVVVAITAMTALTSVAVAGWRTPASAAVANAAQLGFPTTPPAQICDNPAALTGPATVPKRAIALPAGNNSRVNWNRPGVTYWFSPGKHTLGTGATGIVPADNITFIGAPGAIIDGQGINLFAFGGKATGVTVSYLTIQGFAVPRQQGAINHETSARWTIQHNTVQNNGGAGVMLGPSTVVSFNCLRNNGQYGYSSFAKGGDSNITFDHNEVSGNNTANWEAAIPMCGCSGAGKIWITAGGSITNNWIHHNAGPGIWIDTNNTGLLVDGNYVDDNDAEGIVYELSYNGRITNNNLLRNGFVEGRRFAGQNSTFPVAAIYIADSGGDSRVGGGLYGAFDISGNNLDDNWGGVTLWEDGDRFCGSDPAAGVCTLVNPQANFTTCIAGTISSAPYVSDCRWKTQNVSVHDNQLVFSRSDVGCTTTGCGEQAVMAGPGTTPPWSPYLGTGVDNAITSTQNNHFASNTYIGDWQFADFTTNPLTLNAFQAPPYNQDASSALTPLAASNLLDADTANIEGSAGRWVPWFSSNAASSSAQSHGGSHSLWVDITAPFGWGVQLANWPGFKAAPGPQTMSFWALQGTAAAGALGAVMLVDWHDAGGAVLRTDTTAIPTLTSQWQQAATSVVAPAGTASVTVEVKSPTGVSGDSVYLDQVFVGAATPSTNLLDPDTASLEGSIGHWTPGLAATVAQSTAGAQAGSHSLQVAATAPGGWRVQLGTSARFPAAAGVQAVSFWGLQKVGSSAVTMSIDWRDVNGSVLQTDVAAVAGLTATWQQGKARVVAPAGTASVSVGFAGSAGTGDTVYLDTVYVGAPVNLLDADSADFEGSVGRWIPWFSSAIASSTAAFESGTHSLLVNIKAPFGWGVQLANFPGFSAASGNQVMSFWGLQGSAPLAVTMSVDWRDASGAALQTDTLTMAALSPIWQQATKNVFAPAGTAFATVEFSNSGGGAGDTLFLDAVFAGS